MSNFNFIFQDELVSNKEYVNEKIINSSWKLYRYIRTKKNFKSGL